MAASFAQNRSFNSGPVDALGEDNRRPSRAAASDLRLGATLIDLV